MGWMAPNDPEVQPKDGELLVLAIQFNNEKCCKYSLGYQKDGTWYELPADVPIVSKLGIPIQVRGWKKIYPLVLMTEKEKEKIRKIKQRSWNRNDRRKTLGEL